MLNNIKQIIALSTVLVLFGCSGGDDVIPESDICKDATKAWTWAWQKHCDKVAETSKVTNYVD